MNELESLKELLNSKLEGSTLTPEQLDGIISAYNIILKINNDEKALNSLDDPNLICLRNSNIIDDKQYEFLRNSRNSMVINKQLDKDSSDYLKTIISEIINKINSINKKVENKAIRELINIVNKNFYGISETQLDLLFNIVSESNLEKEEKRDILIYISINTIKYQDEFIEEVEEEEEQEIIKGIFLEECIELFSKYGYDFYELDEKNRTFIMANGNYEIIDGILETLKDNNIDLRNNFNRNIIKSKQNNICEILVKSNKECVQNIIDVWVKNEFVENGVVLFYKMIEDPCKFVKEKRDYKRRGVSHGPSRPQDKEETGRYHSYLQNVDFFTEVCHRIYGEDVNYLKIAYENGNASVLNFPHKKILEVDRILKAYGLTEKDYFEAATSVFVSMHHADVLDLAIELDVLDYFKNNQSRLSLPAESRKSNEDKKAVERIVFDLLYLASIHKDIAFSKSIKTNFIGEEVGSFHLNQSLLSLKLADTQIPRGIDSLPHKETVFRIFEERLENSDFDTSIALSMLEKDGVNPIKVLDKYFKEDEYVYNIKGIRISRNKVLRIYSALDGINVDPRLAQYNMVLYALTRNSYLTYKEIISLATAYNEKEIEMRRMEEERQPRDR